MRARGMPGDRLQMTTKAHQSAAGFDALGLRDELVAAVAALGYEEATPVQRETIPLLVGGRDLLAQAATGTGKTAAFALPMLQRLTTGDESRRRIGGLVLVPTRELSMQVAEAVYKNTKSPRVERAGGLRRRPHVAHGGP